MAAFVADDMIEAFKYGDGESLVSFSFGKNFNAYEALLNRMVGNDDDIVDALFSFTHPITGSYFWYPPVKDGKVSL